MHVHLDKGWKIYSAKKKIWGRFKLPIKLNKFGVLCQQVVSIIKTLRSLNQYNFYIGDKKILVFIEIKCFLNYI
jgi:hypothetical protein